MILDKQDITTPLNFVPMPGLSFGPSAPARSLTVQFVFKHGTGGQSCKVWLQTSLDGGETWVDIANGAFLKVDGTELFNMSGTQSVTNPYVPGDGVLADNTCVDGIVGDLYRVKYKTTGTYSNTTVSSSVHFR
jgi:hypothetical protein